MTCTICFLGNAASVHTIRWVNYFADRWDTHLISWRPPTKSLPLRESVSLHRVHFPPHYALRWGTLAEVALICRHVRPDIVHAHYVGTFGIVAGLYSRLTGFHPVVLSAWGPYGLKHSKGVRRMLTKYALRRADCVHTDGSHMRDVLTELGTDMDKVVTTYYGTDVGRFKPTWRSGELRARLANGGKAIVISLRSLEPIYDVESLIRAVPLVLKEVGEAKFVIAGDGAQKEYLESLATELGIAGNVRLIGFIANEQLPKYLTSSDIYVSTSLSDAGLSASTAEAMACGLPVVVTDFGDNGEWVQDDVNGYLFPPGNVEALASRLVDLLGDPGKRRLFGEAGRKVIVERNNYEVEMGRMEQIYLELIGRSNRC